MLHVGSERERARVRVHAAGRRALARVVARPRRRAQPSHPVVGAAGPQQVQVAVGGALDVGGVAGVAPPHRLRRPLLAAVAAAAARGGQELRGARHHVEEARRELLFAAREREDRRSVTGELRHADARRTRPATAVVVRRVGGAVVREPGWEREGGGGGEGAAEEAGRLRGAFAGEPDEDATEGDWADRGGDDARGDDARGAAWRDACVDARVHRMLRGEIEVLERAHHRPEGVCVQLTGVAVRQHAHPDRDQPARPPEGSARQRVQPAAHGSQRPAQRRHVRPQRAVGRHQVAQRRPLVRVYA